MHGTPVTARDALSTAALALLLAACPVSMVGVDELEFQCRAGEDCSEGYLCVEGVCRPEGTVTSDAAAADAAADDAVASDAAGDGAVQDGPAADRGAADALAVDAVAADSALGDTLAGDATAGDATLPDAAPEDAAAADAPASDAAAGDAAALDAGTADTAPGDAAVPDAFSGDQVAADGAPGDAASADVATADSAAADSTTPDSAAGDAGSGCGPPDWWDCDWGARVRLTFDNGQQGEALIDFPVLVRLTPDRADLGRIAAGGADLRFVDPDGNQVLAHELERWADGSGGSIWVKVPQIDASSTSDYIWMYYDNAAAPDIQDPAAVWSADYRGVWHLGDTSSAVGGLPDGSGGATFQPGFVGQAAFFDGSDDHIEVRQNPSVLGTLDNFTVGAWIRPETLHDNWRGLVSSRDQNENDHDSGNWVFQSNDDTFGLESQGQIPNTFRREIPTPRQWHFVAFVIERDQGRALLYLDGREVGRLDGITPPIYDDQNRLLFGSRYFSGIYQARYHGLIDEVRVAATPRSAAWLRAEYLAVADGFIRYGEEPWWDPAFGRRVKLRFASATQQEHLWGFPLLVTLDGTNADYIFIDTQGDDLRFVDADGSLLPHEIEVWSHGGVSLVWVQVPQVNAYSTTDHIWLYYGSVGASSVEDPAAVWGPAYVGVYHLNDDAIDSASTAGDGTVIGASSIGGHIGGAFDFEADEDDRIEIADSPVLDQLRDRLTLSAWVRPESEPWGWVAVVARELGTGNGDIFHFGFWENRYNLHLDFPSGVVRVRPDETPLTNRWVNLVGTYNGRQAVLYVNGVELAREAVADVLPTDDSMVTIGADTDDHAISFKDKFDGRIDEVRLQLVARSPAWILAEYRAVEGALIQYEAEQTP